MIYASLNEAWIQKPRIGDIIKITDADVVAFLKKVDDPNAYLKTLLFKQEQVHDIESFTAPDRHSDNDDDVLIDSNPMFIFLLIMLVLLY